VKPLRGCNDEVEAQRGRWTFYETIILLIPEPSYANFSLNKSQPGADLALRRINFFYAIIRSLGYFLFHVAYRLEIEGRENVPKEGPAVILPKHQFWTDIPIVGLALKKPASFIAKQELFVYPGVRSFISALGGVPIDRLKPVKSLESFRYLELLLQERDFIILYPEGTYYPYSMGRGKHRFIQRILGFQGKKGGPKESLIPFYPHGNPIRTENLPIPGACAHRKADIREGGRRCLGSYKPHHG
jgi:1-acyl-sn-glycerol-3-phosphate acyltransferase